MGKNLLSKKELAQMIGVGLVLLFAGDQEYNRIISEILKSFEEACLP